MTNRITEVNSSPATTFIVEGDLQSQSIAGNYSLIRCYLTAKNGPGGTTGSSFGGAGLQTGTISGVKEFARRQVSTNFLPSGYSDGATRWRLGPYDVQVPHNADGTRAPIKFGMVLDYGSITETVFSADMALPTIPRATTPELRIGSTPVTSFDAGTALTVYLPRASSSFTHDVTYTFGNQTGTIATGAGVSAAWTPPLTMLEAIPDATSGPGKVTVVTKNGSTVIGTKDVSFTLRAPTTVVPTVTAISLTDDNPATASLIGGLVQGQSLLKATVTAAGVFGSTIASAMVTVDGTTVPSGQTLPLPQSGARVVAGAVTDSRGRTGTGTGNISVLPYDLPQIDVFTVERVTAAGVESPTGLSLRMTLNATASSLIVGSEKNDLTITVKTRERGTTTWTTRNVITTGINYDQQVMITGTDIYMASSAWDVQVSVKDKLQESTDFYAVSTAGAILDANETQVGINKMAEATGPNTQIQGPGRLYDAWDVDGRKVLDAGDFATVAEAIAGLLNDRVVTPEALAAVFATKALPASLANWSTTGTFSITADAAAWQVITGMKVASLSFGVLPRPLRVRATFFAESTATGTPYTMIGVRAAGGLALAPEARQEDGTSFSGITPFANTAQAALFGEKVFDIPAGPATTFTLEARRNGTTGSNYANYAGLRLTPEAWL